MSNPLVAERQDSTTAYSGIGIVESAVDTYNGISSGSWVEGGLGLAGAGLETLGLVIDPVGTLVGYGVAWLMEHVKPLSDALDWLAGDPDTIASYAQTWRNVSQAIGQAKTDFDTAVSNDTAAWTGTAADNYRRMAAEQSEQISAAATSADTVGTVVEVVGVLVGVVREVVRDLIADCVATLIARIPQWLAEIAGTLGIATPHVVASAVTLISRWVARISDVIQKLVRSVNNLRPLLRRLDEIWAAIKNGLRGLSPGSPSTPNSPGTPNAPSSTTPVSDPNSVTPPTVNSPTTTPTSTPGPTPTSPSTAPTVSPTTAPTTTAPSSTAPSSVTDAPTVRPETTPPTSSTTPPTSTTDPVSPAPTTSNGSQPPLQSGGRTRPRDEMDFGAQQRWADDAYDRIRATDQDVDLISQNTGIPREDVANVKQHLFENEHPLTNYDDPTGPPIMSRFDSDGDIAEAWIRMADGRATPEDMALLRHEIAEQNYMRDNPGSTYSEAHQHANTVSNWQDNIPPSTREDLDDLPWNRDGSTGSSTGSSTGTSTGDNVRPTGDGPPQTGGRDGSTSTTSTTGDGQPTSSTGAGTGAGTGGTSVGTGGTTTGVDPASPTGSTDVDPTTTDPDALTDPDAVTDTDPTTTDTDPTTTTDGDGTGEGDGPDGDGDGDGTGSGDGSGDGNDGGDGTGDGDSALSPEDREPQFDRDSLNQETFEEQYQRVLDERGIDRAEHDALRMTPADQLTDAQRQQVIDVRNALAAEPGSVQTKVLSDAVANLYLDNVTSTPRGAFDGSTVTGFTARDVDVIDVNTPQGLRDGLALDDGGAGWTPIPEGAENAYQLRFQVPEDADMPIAYGGQDPLTAQQMQDLSGNSRPISEGAPFLGTGYTAGGLPEWHAQGVSLGERAEIWQLDRAGNEVLVGIFDGNQWHRL